MQTNMELFFTKTQTLRTMQNLNKKKRDKELTTQELFMYTFKLIQIFIKKNQRDISKKDTIYPSTRSRGIN